jgi:transposase
MTKDQISNVVSDYNSGLPIKDIAKRNNISIRSIYRALRKEAK